ncbi:MAG: response regulator [Candidatus Cloacimonetes bacterium]|nr:response regulator [Candidatus Cloacimonadota bacterium]MCF7813975.1 response regulator [Candidatus Cloacimonadota bacterium]MCF7868819.1 response regulator [Candidatus Cloacimonadota bacterium]MCF7884078.1 response regulator [Candidatus Cloacimonadota bacterium]
MKILVVDDEVSMTDFLKVELKQCCKDLEVITKNTGYEALNRLMQGDIDLLLTDIAMPDMDGYELYKRARDYDENIPIIMMTGFGYDPNHTVVKSRQDGLQDVLFKPFDVDKLFALIKKRIKGE